MDMLAQFGYFGQANVWVCSLYGLLMLTVNVWLAVHLKKPEKEDL